MALTKSTQAEIGSIAPSFNLPATDGKDYSLDSFKDSKGLVVVFTCNHCPYAKAAWPLLVRLANEFKEKGISFIGINPNDEKQYPEDSFEVMKKRVVDWHIDFPYLRDKAQKTAKDYGAVCTPDIYVLDQNRKLFYHGRINDNWPPVEKTPEGYKPKQSEGIVKQELKEALQSLLGESPPPITQNPSMGCSIKWTL